MALVEVPPHRALDALPAQLTAKRAEVAQLQEHLARVQQEIALLQPQLRYVQAQDAVERGATHYNNQCATVTEVATQIPAAWETFVMQCAAFVHLSDDQARGLASLPGADGQPVFTLPSGAVLVERLLERLPHQQHPGALAHTVLETIRTPLTAEDHDKVIAAAINRQRPDPALVERFLQGYEPHNPEGTENGHS
jgi:uncharacterized coiled-coil protein SlyX